MNPIEKVKLWNRDFILIILISLTTSIAMQILNSTMSLYADDLGASTTFSGTMATLFAITAGATRLISGNLSDRYSRRVFMIIGSIIFALSLFAFGMIAILPALLIFRTIQGVGFSSVNTASAAAAADVIPKKRLGEGLGYYSMSMAIAMAFGPLLGLPLARAGQFSLLYGICAVSLILCLVFSIMSTYEKRRAANDENRQPAAQLPTLSTERGVWKILEKKALPAAIIYMIFCFSTACLISFLPLYAKDAGIETISWFYLVEATSMFVVRLLTGKVFDRRGPLPMIIPSMLIGTLAFVLFDFVGNDWTFLIPAALFGVALGMGLPVFNALAVQDVAHHRRGAASATFMLFLDIGIGFGASIWGIVLDLSGKNYSVMFYGAAGCTLLTLVLSLIFFSRRTGKSVPAESVPGTETEVTP